MYSVQLSSISSLPSLSLSSPREDPPTPPLPWNGIHHHHQVHQGCPWMPPPWWLPMRIAHVKVVVVLIADRGGIPVNLASRQDNDTMCNELQSNNLAHKGGSREGGLIFYGLGESGGWDKVQLGKHRTLVWVRRIWQILNWHCFLRDKHTTFFVYYMWAQSDKVVSVSASIRRPA